MRGEGSTIPGTGGNHAGMARSQGYFPNAFDIAGNPLTDPRFKIPGGQPWNKTPLLPGNDTKKFEERSFTVPFTLPSATNVPLAMNVGNVGGMITQVDPRAAALGSLMQAGGLPPGYARKTIS